MTESSLLSLLTFPHFYWFFFFFSPFLYEIIECSSLLWDFKGFLKPNIDACLYDVQDNAAVFFENLSILKVRITE